MILLTRETDFAAEAKEYDPIYPSTSYPYQHIENNFAPLQDWSDAIFDAAIKRLITQKGVETVYSDDYGMDWIEIRSQSNGWIKTHLPDLIKESLLQDDRVTEVSARIVEVNKDYILISVSVNGATGEIMI